MLAACTPVDTASAIKLSRPADLSDASEVSPFIGAADPKNVYAWVVLNTPKAGVSGSVAIVGDTPYRPERITAHGITVGGRTQCGERTLDLFSVFDGELVTTVIGDNERSFVLDGFQRNDQCDAPPLVYAAHYAATVNELTPQANNEFPIESLSNGRGTVVIKGLRADVVTEDLYEDARICNREPLSGRTTITAAGRTAVVTYDGATVCDGYVPWTLDGVEQDWVRPCASATPELLAFVVAARLLLRSRRRPRRS
jgi:hypothetical protein